MSFSQTFKDLIVWQKSHNLVLDIYRLSDDFPQREIYSLTSQLRRAAISIPANIAEGYKKTGIADKLRFLNIARGSLEEVRYYLILAQDLRYAKTDDMSDKLDEVGKLLYGYMKGIVSNMRH